MYKRCPTVPPESPLGLKCLNSLWAPSEYRNRKINRLPQCAYGCACMHLPFLLGVFYTNIALGINCMKYQAKMKSMRAARIRFVEIVVLTFRNAIFDMDLKIKTMKIFRNVENYGLLMVCCVSFLLTGDISFLLKIKYRLLYIKVISAVLRMFKTET